MARLKELKWQKAKEEKVIKKREDVFIQENLQRRNSYTIKSPIFDFSVLPKISGSSESDKETVIGLESSFQSEFTDKSSKDLLNEIDKRSTTPSSLYAAVIEPQVNSQLKDLIEKQKREYLNAMETLKNKFTNEQHQLLMNIQSNLLVTSTPLNHSVMSTTDDEDFTAFRTCLQSISQSQNVEEKTIINDADTKVRISKNSDSLKNLVNFRSKPLQQSTLILEAS